MLSFIMDNFSIDTHELKNDIYMISIFLQNNYSESTAKKLHQNEDKSIYKKIFKNRHVYFLECGKRAIAEILKTLKLQTDDEVFISTSTNNNYISSCVTCTIFNFCQPSKILTGKTKAIFLIHEYGIPHPKIFEYFKEAKKRKIPLIEDCAQTMDTRYSKKIAGISGNTPYVGSTGDYSIYSLPKIFPMKNGGILSSKKKMNFRLNKEDKTALKSVRTEFEKYIPFLKNYSDARKKNYRNLKKYFLPRIPLNTINLTYITPYFFPVKLNKFNYKTFSGAKIELGASLDPNLLLLPTQAYNNYTLKTLSNFDEYR